MTQPWQRINEIVVASTHPTRKTEHVVLVRLLQRSKNQHRHGLYFRRLQHVQRFLRDINDHPAWAYLDDLVSKDKKTKNVKGKLGDFASKQTKLLSLSMRDAIESLFNQLDSLIKTIIPKAARSIIVHLVALGQFIPFAVTICACLARLFVIERTLRNELQVILRNINVLIASKALDSSSIHESGDEDVGMVVSEDEAIDVQEVTKLKDVNVAKRTANVEPEDFEDSQDSEDSRDSGDSGDSEDSEESEENSLPNEESEINKTRGQRNCLSKEDKNGPSLYCVLAEGGVPQNMLDKIANSADALPAESEIDGDTMKTEKREVGKRKRTRGVTKTKKDKRQKLEDDGNCTKSAATSPPTSTAINANLKSPVLQGGCRDPFEEKPKESLASSSRSADASGSEDIDDIFRDLL